MPISAAEAEAAVLGSILLAGPTCYASSCRSLTPEMFFAPSRAKLFGFLADYYRAGGVADPLAIRAELESSGLLEEVGGADALAAFVDSVPSSANADYYAGIVLRAAVARVLLTASAAGAARLKDPGGDLIAVLADLEAAVLRARSMLRDSELEPDLPALVGQVIDRLESIKAGEPPGDRTPTGWSELDAALGGGIAKARLYFVGGRTSMGKSCFAANLAVRLARAGKRVLYLALETGAAELVGNVLASESRVRRDAIESGKLTHADWGNLAQGCAAVAPLPIVVSDRVGIGAEDAWARAKAEQARSGLDLLVIDYLQLLRGPRGVPREQEVAHVSRTMRVIAKDLNVPVVALAQLRRETENRSDPRPKLSDLRESGQIENDADVVLLLYRDEYYHPESDRKGIMDVHVAKSKLGPVRNVPLAFLAPYLRIENLEQHVSTPHFQEPGE